MFSFFSRIVGEQSTKNNEKTSPQRKRKVDWRDIFHNEEFKEVLTQPESPSSKKPSKEPQSYTLHKIGEMPVRNERMKQKNRNVERRRVKNKKIERDEHISEKRRAHQSLSLHLNQLSSKEAMKGVIWSEILGPPRAKRRHTPHFKNK